MTAREQFDAALAALLTEAHDFGAAEATAASQATLDALRSENAVQAASLTVKDATIAAQAAEIARLTALLPPEPVDPWAGMLYGANDSHFGPLNAALGRELQVRRFYEAGWPSTPTQKMRDDWAAGRVPYVSFSGPSPATINSGAHDAILASFFKACKDRTLVSYIHEVDNGKAQPAEYVAACTRIQRIKDENAPDPRLVLHGPTLMGWAFTVGDYEKWIAPKVDFIGADPYNFVRPAGSPPSPKTGNLGRDRSMAYLLGTLPAFAKKRGVPIAIGEYGVHPDPARPSFKPDWLKATDATLRAAGCIAACYFHAPYGEDGPWWLDRQHTYVTDTTARATGTPDPESVAAFRSLIKH
ncbi:hypothetical protein [Terrabacter sp. NPDC000476]|uniref:hypothetical protein n=1 Tax=Terrabacter sp. NPDC000476 TaxID=3154258 RepID=UPI003326D0A1